MHCWMTNAYLKNVFFTISILSLEFTTFKSLIVVLNFFNDKTGAYFSVIIVLAEKYYSIPYFCGTFPAPPYFLYS